MFVTVSIFLSIFLSFGDSKITDFLNLNLHDEELSTRFTRDVSSASKDDGSRVLSIIIAPLINGFIKLDLNLSIIGWQNVYDDEGNVIEVKTIELAFPIKNESNAKITLKEVADMGFFKDQNSQNSKLPKSNFEAHGVRNVTTSNLFIEIFNGYEQPTNLWYFDRSTSYFRPKDGLAKIKKKLVATKEEVETFLNMEKQKELLLKPLMVKYDAEGNLEAEESDLASLSSVSYVLDSWKASNEILLGGPRILAEVALKHEKKDIPKNLVEKFNEEFEEYEWRVLVNPGELFINRNVWIQVSTDGFEYEDGKKDVYFVYGILKS